jgi:hypothetical protein
MSQTTVTAAPIGCPGDIADGDTVRNGRRPARRSEEASAVILPGIMVKRGTGDYGVLKLTATTNVLDGISVRSHDVAIGTEVDETTGGYKPGAVFASAQTGSYFVLIEEDVTPSSDVRVRCVATGDEVAGAFRTSADSTDCVDLTPCAKWVRTALAADGVGELWIDMNNIGLAVAD